MSEKRKYSCGHSDGPAHYNCEGVGDGVQVDRHAFKQPRFLDPRALQFEKVTPLGCWEEIDLSLLWDVPPPSPPPGDWSSWSWPDQLSHKQAEAQPRSWSQAGARFSGFLYPPGWPEPSTGLMAEFVFPWPPPLDSRSFRHALKQHPEEQSPFGAFSPPRSAEAPQACSSSPNTHRSHPPAQSHPPSSL